MVPTEKVLSQEILILNIKALSLTLQKLLARLEFQRGGENDRFTKWQKGQKQCVPDLQTGGHKNQINVNHFVCYRFQVRLIIYFLLSPK